MCVCVCMYEKYNTRGKYDVSNNINKFNAYIYIYIYIYLYTYECHITKGYMHYYLFTYCVTYLPGLTLNRDNDDSSFRNAGLHAPVIITSK